MPIERGTLLAARSLDRAFVASQPTIVQPPVITARPDAPTVVTHAVPRAIAARPDAPTIVMQRPSRLARGSAPHVMPSKPPPVPPRAAKRTSNPTVLAPADVQAAKPPASTSTSSSNPTVLAPADVQAAKPPAPTSTSSSNPTVLAPADVQAAKPRVTTPPAEVFALIRRIALQRDLAGAAGVLHAGLGELIASRVVLVEVGEGGALASPNVGDMRDAAAAVPLPAIPEALRRRQRFIASRVVMLPLATSRPCVLVAWRTPKQPALDTVALRLFEQTAARLGVLDHALALAADANAQAVADDASVFRAEALAASRTDRREGAMIDLSPRIVRIAIPLLVVAAAVLVTLAALVQVPTYSRGTVVVKSNGHTVIANSGGRISAIHVTPGQRVVAGDALVALDTTRETQELAHIETLYRNQLSTFMFDPTDEAARLSLAAIVPQRRAALDALAAKTITAPVDGTVSDVLVSDLVNAGEHVATIVPDDAVPSVLAFMPGIDRSRIRPGMPIQIELTGYPGSRLVLAVSEVGTEIMGQATARKFLGQKLADAIALPSSVVVVKATLPPGGFESRGKRYSYFDGMDGLAEIEIDSKSFLSVVIPTGDRK